MEIANPIFIIGSGRSGTTIFYNLLSTHPEVCWFSNYSDHFNKISLMPILHRILDIPLLGTIAKKGIIAKKRKFLRPAEAERIYHDSCGFEHGIKTTELDLDLDAERNFKAIIKKHLLLTGKERFLTKQTANNQRIRLINKMFNDAYFIHVIRDGRAVANSLLKVKWWENTDIWWLEKKVSEWEKRNKHSIELCGMQWKMDVEELLKNKNLYKDRYIEVKYEEFILDVKGTMKKVLNFCELSDSKLFYNLLPQSLPNMNLKWKTDLSNGQKELLDHKLKPLLTQLGYH